MCFGMKRQATKSQQAGRRPFLIYGEAEATSHVMAPKANNRRPRSLGESFVLAWLLGVVIRGIYFMPNTWWAPDCWGETPPNSKERKRDLKTHKMRASGESSKKREPL